jgi:hypothetical protein
VSEFKDRVNEELEVLRALRDEARVQLNLAGAEARDQWESLEKDWEHVEGKIKVVGEEAKSVIEDVDDALELVFDQLREGYTRIKKLL